MAHLNRATAALNALWKLSLGVGMLGAVSTFSMYNVDGGQRALIFGRFQNGLIGGARGEGTHFYIPVLQWPIIMDVRTRYTKLQAETGSKDLQNVHLVLRVLYKPEIERLTEIYRVLGTDWDDKVLPSIGNEILTSTVARYDAVELITQREQVSQTIREGLIERLGRYHIQLEDVSITHLTFSPEYTSAIEKKQVAQQDAERSKYIVDKAKQEALASMIRAEGESEAARLITQASGAAFIELRRLEAAREIAESLSTSPNVSYVPGGQVLFNLGGKL